MERMELELETIVPGGEAIAHHQGMAIFVPFGAPGDLVEVEVISTKPQYARALIKRIIKEGPDRVAPRCPFFGRCGGCQLQHLSYPAQLESKRGIVIDSLERLSKLEGFDREKVNPVLPGDPWYYRNKVHWAIEGKAIGLYEARSHKVVEAPHCFIQHPLNNLVLDFLRKEIKNFGFPRDWLKSAFAKVGHHTDELMIGLVSSADAFSRQAEWSADIRDRFPEIRSIVQNVNKNPGNTLMGKKNLILWGKEAIHEKIGDLTFSVSPLSFFQVNSLQVEALYDEVARMAELSGKERVVDAYAGTGTIALFLAGRASEVVGIESVPEATRDAASNARSNGIKNVRFLTGLVEERLGALTREFKPHVVVLDPPRKGCEAAAIQAIGEARPRRVVYVSCNPATLARDLSRLAEVGYRLDEVTPVDMFPQTAHVECVARLSLKE